MQIKSNSTVAELKKAIVASLSDSIGKGERQAFAQILMEEIFGIQKTDEIVNQTIEINTSNHNTLMHYVEELNTFKPIQYVLKKAWFFDLKLTVSSATLIPRPETEELVQLILDKVENNSKLHVLDIGTGSGCIPLAIKFFRPEWEVTGMEISEEALAIAKQNAIENELEVHWEKRDILKMPIEGEWDILVSNPPYIPEKEKTSMQPNVLDFEPELALFVPDQDPLLFYRTIAEKGIAALKQNGMLFFEIHEEYGEQTKELLEQNGYVSIYLHQDLQNKQRMVSALKG